MKSRSFGLGFVGNMFGVNGIGPEFWRLGLRGLVSGTSGCDGRMQEAPLQGSPSQDHCHRPVRNGSVYSPVSRRIDRSY